MLDKLGPVILLVIVCVLASYYMAGVWAPLGYIGGLAAFALVINYFYQRFARLRR
jgi:hypothetical protein